MPLASLSLDLDNQWSYMKTHGDAGWDHFPSYLDLVIPRFLEIFDELETKITVFVVGQDAALEKNHDALRLIPEHGHEVGNHSFHHEPWLHLYEKEQVEEEFETSEKAIFEATGEKTIGFRGPGFSFSPTTLRTMAARGYQYDCSTFPTYLGPLARAYYFMTAKLPKEERAKRSQLFGKFSEGFRRVKPYHWDLGANRRLLEIPVTTMPGFKIPIHLSYLLYFAKFSPLLAMTHFRAALTLCKLTGTQPSILLHPLDFLGKDDNVGLDFFPAMQQEADVKLAFARKALALYAKKFKVGPMRDHAAALMDAKLKEIPVSKESPPISPPTEHQKHLAP